jgi:hypothetical protein
MAATQPFPLPRRLPPNFATVFHYWKSLLRAENPMPFSDDVDLGKLSQIAEGLLLIDVFKEPQRFRFSHLGATVVTRLGSSVVEKFVDEVQPRDPFDYLQAQASATVEARSPSLYASKGSTGYSRSLLPTWGDGKVGLLLGAIV